MYALLLHFFCKITTYTLHRTIFDEQNPGIGQIIFSAPLVATRDIQQTNYLGGLISAGL